VIGHLRIKSVTWPFRRVNCRFSNTDPGLTKQQMPAIKVRCHKVPNSSRTQTYGAEMMEGDYLLTTDPTGELAPADGYLPQGVICYVHTSPHTDTIPFFRWYHEANGWHFYTTDPDGEQALAKGFHSESVGFYAPQDPGPDTVPLYRWFHPVGCHYYTTDPKDAVSEAEGFKMVGIACQVYGNQQPDSVPLYRWFLERKTSV